MQVYVLFVYVCCHFLLRPEAMAACDLKAELEKVCVGDPADWNAWCEPMLQLLVSQRVGQLLASVKAYNDTVSYRNNLAHAFIEVQPLADSAFSAVVEQARTLLAMCNVAQKLFAMPGPKATRSSMVSQALQALRNAPNAMPVKLEEATRRILNRKA